MNLTEFLAELRKTRNGWSAGCSLRKKARRGEHCPVTAVCARVKKTRFSPAEFGEAGKRLGLSDGLVGRIIDASDVLSDGAEPRLRASLLRAVGK